MTAVFPSLRRASAPDTLVRGAKAAIARFSPQVAAFIDWLQSSTGSARSVASALFCLLALLGTACAQAEDFTSIPPLTSHVVDRAGMLSAQQRNTLDQVLTDYESRTGSQIAVLLIDSTVPEAIEQYSIRVAEAWKLGRAGVDDGVILLVAKNNPASLRRLRIEAGRGVQGTLTDAQSKRILQDVIAPHFRQNDFYGGLAAGVAAITALLDEEKLPGPKKKPAPADAGMDWGSVLMFVLFIVLSIWLNSRRGRHRPFSSNGWGRGPGIILGGGAAGWGSDFPRGGGGGGFTGGGGFSGGGGTFDGGGASGDW